MQQPATIVGGGGQGLCRGGGAGGGSWSGGGKGKTGYCDWDQKGNKGKYKGKQDQAARQNT